MSEKSLLLPKTDQKTVEMNDSIRKLSWSTIASLLFMIIEIVGGYWAGSLAIMSDAAHLLTDVASNLVAISAIYIASLPPSGRSSFGYLRAEVLGAILSVLMIWFLTGILIYEAVLRTQDLLSPNPHIHTDGRMMSIVAGLGLLFNLMNLAILGEHGHSHGLGSEDDHGHSHGHEGGSRNENINVSGARMHMISDLIQSVGVMIAGLVIWWKPEWQLFDPACTFLFSLLVLSTTVKILKTSLSVLMESTPDNVSSCGVLILLIYLICLGGKPVGDQAGARNFIQIN
jgi:zinc transporter 2